MGSFTFALLARHHHFLHPTHTPHSHWLPQSTRLSCLYFKIINCRVRNHGRYFEFMTSNFRDCVTQKHPSLSFVSIQTGPKNDKIRHVSIVHIYISHIYASYIYIIEQKCLHLPPHPPNIPTVIVINRTVLSFFAQALLALHSLPSCSSWCCHLASPPRQLASPLLSVWTFHRDGRWRGGMRRGWDCGQKCL